MEYLVDYYIGEIKINSKGYTLELSGDLKTLKINGKKYKRINNRKYDNLKFSYDIMEYISKTIIKKNYKKVYVKFPLIYCVENKSNYKIHPYYEKFLTKMIDLEKNGGIYIHDNVKVIYPLDFYAKGKNIIAYDGEYISEMFICAKKNSSYIKTLIEKLLYNIKNNIVTKNYQEFLGLNIIPDDYQKLYFNYGIKDVYLNEIKNHERYVIMNLEKYYLMKNNYNNYL